MNFFRKATFVLAVAAASASSFAQLGGMAPPNTDYMPIIFLNPAVAKDMHLSPAVAQKEQNSIIQNAMAMIPLLQDKGGNGKASREEKMAAASMAAYQKMEDASLAPLNAPQKARYRQLSLQFFGAAALVQPKVSKAVGLTPGQKSKLNAALQSAAMGMAGKAKSMQNGAAGMGGMGAITGMMSESRAVTEKKAKAILTPAQWAKWSALQGRKLPGIDNIFGGLGGGGMGGGMGLGG